VNGLLLEPRYAPGATMWGTLAQSLTTMPRDIETYFIEATRACRCLRWVGRGGGDEFPQSEYHGGAALRPSKWNAGIKDLIAASRTGDVHGQQMTGRPVGQDWPHAI